MARSPRLGERATALPPQTPAGSDNAGMDLGVGTAPGTDSSMSPVTDHGSRSSDRVKATARRWVDVWTRGDLDEMRGMLTDDAVIECNLGWPDGHETLLDTSRRLSRVLDSTMILSVTAADNRAAVLSDCRILDPSGSIRLAEFIDVTGDRVVGVRRVFDLTAVDALLPDLRGPGEPTLPKDLPLPA